MIAQHSMAAEQSTWSWFSFVVGGLATVGISFLSKLIDVTVDDWKRQREASRAVFDASWDLQHAVWEFVGLHMRFGVAQGVREFEAEKQQILAKIGSPLRVLTRDYDLPQNLIETCRRCSDSINLEFANLVSFTMTGQTAELEESAKRIQAACESMREDARRWSQGPLQWLSRLLPQRLRRR
jgi:hypothetical protein